jgi:ABC-type transport system involved in multi-copper enzyme maturation permease subunit
MIENFLLLPLAVVPGWLVSWLTPLWLIGVGAALALLVLLMLWGLLAVVWRRAATSVPVVLGEGPMPLLMGAVLLAALFAAVGFFVVRTPGAVLSSIPRLLAVESREFTHKLSPNAKVEAVPIQLRGDEVVSLGITADEPVEMYDAANETERSMPVADIGPGRSFRWLKVQDNVPLLEGRYIDQLFITNLADREATVTFKVAAQPAYPAAWAVPITALSVLGVVLLYFAQAWFLPRINAIALATTKSELAQPLFWILLALGSFFLVLFVFLPYNTFGEDIKMMKDSSLTLVMILGIIQGVWAASNSVADEIEGRTALTVLSKPVGRQQFILGKIAGILWTVALMFTLLGIVLAVLVAYKPVYDAREMGSEVPDWTLVYTELARTIPGLVLGFLEATVLVCLSVAISTRLPMLANFAICFSIYVLGHLTALIVLSSVQFAPVMFVAQFIATILPVLDYFNIQAAVAAGREVPLHYLAWSFVYCVLYSSIALLLALILFEDRDLA